MIIFVLWLPRQLYLVKQRTDHGPRCLLTARVPRRSRARGSVHSKAPAYKFKKSTKMHKLLFTVNSRLSSAPITVPKCSSSLQRLNYNMKHIDSELKWVCKHIILIYRLQNFLNISRNYIIILLWQAMRH